MALVVILGVAGGAGLLAADGDGTVPVSTHGRDAEGPGLSEPEPAPATSVAPEVTVGPPGARARQDTVAAFFDALVAGDETAARARLRPGVTPAWFGELLGRGSTLDVVVRAAPQPQHGLVEVQVVADEPVWGTLRTTPGCPFYALVVDGRDGSLVIDAFTSCAAPPAPR